MGTPPQRHESVTSRFRHRNKLAERLVGPVVRHPALCLRIMSLVVCRRICWRYRLEKDGTCIYDSRCSLQGLLSR
jgi:hypothetical protein